MGARECKQVSSCTSRAPGASGCTLSLMGSGASHERTRGNAPQGLRLAAFTAARASPAAPECTGRPKVSSIHVMLAQERDHAGMVRTGRALVVQPTPGDLDLLPAHDLAVDHVGQGDPVGTAPAGVDHAFTCHWRTKDHVSRVPFVAAGLFLDMMRG